MPHQRCVLKDGFNEQAIAGFNEQASASLNERHLPDCDKQRPATACYNKAVYTVWLKEVSNRRHSNCALVVISNRMPLHATLAL